MFLILGILALITTILNLYRYFLGQDNSTYMYLAIVFTALTLCAEHSMIASWVESNDWVALMDVVPFMDNALWLLTILSIVVNAIPFLLKNKKKPN